MRIRWAWDVECIGQKWNERKILVEKAEGRRPLGRHTREWDDNIITIIASVSVHKN
jgi:hypothetical protein